MRRLELNLGEEVCYADFVRRCACDRNSLIRALRRRYDGLEGKLPAELVADIIFDVCHWTIVERRLHFDQQAYSDFGNRKIRMSSRLDLMAADEEQKPLAFRRCALTHELGHIRLHGPEICSMEFRSYLGPDQGYDDPRHPQKEREAEAYAAIFLVPLGPLRRTEQALRLESAIRERPTMEATEIWSLIRPLADAFGVTVAMMARSLACHGYLQPIPYPVPRSWIPRLGNGEKHEIEEDYEDEGFHD